VDETACGKVRGLCGWPRVETPIGLVANGSVIPPSGPPESALSHCTLSRRPTQATCLQNRPNTWRRSNYRPKATQRRDAWPPGSRPATGSAEALPPSSRRAGSHDTLFVSWVLGAIAVVISYRMMARMDNRLGRRAHGIQTMPWLPASAAWRSGANMKFLRALRRVAAAAMVTGIAVLLYWTLIWYHYYDTLPRSPRPAEGRVLAINMHGVTAYGTRREKDRLDIPFYVAALLVNLGIVGGAVTDSSFRKKMGWHPINPPPGAGPDL
jgi:hypothetical protein